MQRRISMAAVGLNFGRHIVKHLTEGVASEWFELVAVCDQHTARADAIGQKIGVRTCYSLDEILADPAIETVGLFTGPQGRADLVRRCLHAGKDVMTTKPFESNSRAACEVLHEARRLGRVVHLNSPSPLLTPDLEQIVAWRAQWQLGSAVACRADVWCSYYEQPDGSWYDETPKCPVAPIFRLGIYLINDLVRLFGPAERVQVLHSRLFTGRPTPDNAQLGILFKNGALANIFASFCVNDGHIYRNSLTLNFQNGTIFRNIGPQRAGRGSELSLVMNTDEGGAVAAQAITAGGTGDYQWEAFARAVRGEQLPNMITPQEIVAGLQIIEAMGRADAGDGTATVASTPVESPWMESDND